MAVQAGDAEQPGQVDRAVDLVQLALAQVELAQQVVGQVRRAVVGHLQAHRVTVAARQQLAAQRAGQVLDVLVQRQVGVARQAKLVAALDAHAMEQVVGMGVDHRGEEHEVVARAADLLGNADQPWQQARRRQDRQAGIAAEGVHAFQLDDEVQALVHQQRERVSRVQADRRHDRRDLLAEVATHPGLDLGGPLPAANETDLLLGQFGQQHIMEDRVLAGDLLMHHLANARQRLVRLQAVGAGLLAGEVDLLLQAGNADLEELVQVAGEDQQELQTLQQRVGLVQRHVQHADVELQLGQLAVDVQAGVVQVAHRRHGRLGRYRQRVDLRRLDPFQKLGGCTVDRNVGVHLDSLLIS